jgi:hypothetical protein
MSRMAPHVSTRPGAAVQRRRDWHVLLGAVLVSGLLIASYLVPSSLAARQRDREREQSAVDAQRRVLEQARDRRARAMMQRPSWEAARREIQSLRDRGMVHGYDFDTGTMKVDAAAWSAMSIVDKQTTARLFWVACTAPEDGTARDVRIVSGPDDTLLGEYDARNGATVVR